MGTLRGIIWSAVIGCFATAFAVPTLAGFEDQRPLRHTTRGRLSALGAREAVAQPMVAGASWSSLARMGTSRRSHTMTLLPNGKVLVAGGDNGELIDSAELYDPASGTWTPTGSLATARSNHTATLLPSGQVLVVGGYVGDGLEGAELYDPASETWTVTGSLLTGRGEHTATLLPSGKVLVAGGHPAFRGSLNAIATAELYDPGSGTWTSTGSLATGRGLHTATLLRGGTVLVAGGDGATGPLASVELYDPSSGAWTPKGPLVTRRGYHTATLLAGGAVLVTGGGGPAGTLASAELYDPASGTWTATGSLAAAREQHASTLLPNGQVLVSGGRDPDTFLAFLASAELYDPASGTWTPAGSLVTERSRHTATLLPGGKVLVAGGYRYVEAFVHSSAELFVSASGSWAAAGSLATTRSNHTATLLPSGKVLVAGGYNNTFLDSAGLYDPASDTWTATGPLSIVRNQHTATLLPSGHVLVAGGNDASSFITGSELYDPASGTWTATGPLAIGRSNHTATLLPSGHVLVTGGNDLASAELYDSVSGTWARGGSLVVDRYDHTATLLPSGKVLIAGGYGPGQALASTELYDGVNGTSSASGSLATERYGHSATLLLSGKVLVVGGLNARTLGTAELYDPASGIWAATGSLATGRRNHTATLLPSGQVLVTGGRSGVSETVNLDSVELYDPANGTWTVIAPLASARQLASATLLPSGRVLVAGGRVGSLYLDTAELYDQGLFAEARRPVVTAAPGTMTHGVPLVIEGTFRGDSEAGGGGTNASAVNYPLTQVRSLLNEQVSWLVPDARVAPNANFWDDPMTLTFSSLPATLTPGWSLLTVIVDGVPSISRQIELQCGVVIVGQPADQVAGLNSSATFAVVTQGARTYQWHKDGIPVPGATAASYTTPPVIGPDSGAQYHVVVSGACGTVADTRTSDAATLTVADDGPPFVRDISPAGGEYWLLSDADGTKPPNTEIVSWSMSDVVRICKVEVSLIYSIDGGRTYGGEVPLLSSGPGGSCTHAQRVDGVQRLTYEVPTAPPSGRAGSLYKIRVRAQDQLGDIDPAHVAVAESLRPFNIVAANTESVRTLIVMHSGRMVISADLRAKLSELANHPRVLGYVLDLNDVTNVLDLYGSWDADPGNPDQANAVLFGCHAPLPSGCAAEKSGIHDTIRSLLSIYTAVEYLVVVGDDRTIPFARIQDRTALLPESSYPKTTAGADLTPTGTTVGRALAANKYLSDDPLGVADAIRPDHLSNSLFIPDLSVGRLVETPEEITTTIATFIAQDGVLDLSALNASTGHKVLVTGYDFLTDAAKRVRERWKAALGSATEDDSTAPVDGALVGATWGETSVEDRTSALRRHLSGNGGSRYGVMSLNGHATHYEEGVPGTNPFDIQGLGTSDLYGADACSSPTQGALNLAGGVVYAVGCHGGLPVAGSCYGDGDHSLDLPQTMLSRGVVSYVANTGYGWGLKHGIGYGERLAEILTEELTKGGTAVTGDAVKRAKQRYYLETPRYDQYDEKSLMQWTLFGLPMYAVRTGIGSSAPVAGAGARAFFEGRHTETLGDPESPVMAESSIEASSELPAYLTELELHFDFTAPGVYTKRNASGDDATRVPALEIAGCPAPAPGEAEGCYYTLNGLVERSTGAGDLPIQPYFIYDSRLSGTSQHGVLWKGGKYDEETGWVPVIGELVSNGGDGSNHGSLPRKAMIEPVSPRVVVGRDPEACRPSDLELNSLVVTTGEAVKNQASDPAYTIERLYREVNLEAFYFNNTKDASGNCDRRGPDLGATPYHTTSGTTINWAVPAIDRDQTGAVVPDGVWRVVVVYNDGTTRNEWVPLELVEDGNGTWRESRTFGGGRITYVIQAVDKRGNVTWLNYASAQLPASGVPLGVAEAVDVSFTGSGPTVSIDDRAVAEGGAVNASFRVVLSAASSQTIMVQYATSGGTATAPGDFAPTTGTLTFSPGRTTHSVYVPIVTDTIAEGTQTFFLTLSNPTDATLGRSQATGTILDPPAPANVPMYRAYNPSAFYHFFTTSLAEFQNAVAAGYQDESNPPCCAVPFMVSNVAQPQSAAINRMYNPNNGRHYYTADAGERNALMAIGWVYEKDEGFIHTSQVPGTTTVFRLWNNISGVHLYTARPEEKAAILDTFPGIWLEHAPLGFAFP